MVAVVSKHLFDISMSYVPVNNLLNFVENSKKTSCITQKSRFFSQLFNVATDFQISNKCAKATATMLLFYLKPQRPHQASWLTSKKISKCKAVGVEKYLLLKFSAPRYFELEKLIVSQSRLFISTCWSQMIKAHRSCRL